MPDYIFPATQYPGRVVLAHSFLPIESFSCCPHCGTVLGTKVDGEVSLHVVDPGWSGFSDGGFGLRPPLPPRTLSDGDTKAKCPYCDGEVDLDTVVQRDPDDFRTLEM